MDKFVKCLLFVFCFFLFQFVAFSQSGIRYSEFAKKIETYFHPDLIADVTKEIPKGDFTVWGWDVGDFSDDGNNDLAFCVRISGQKDKSVNVYIFTDIDGFLVKSGQFKYDFIELPLEVGVAFRYGILYVTQKFKQFNWKIESFKFENGGLINYDKYFTERKNKLTNERLRNFSNLSNTEKYLTTSSGKTEFWADYLTIPSYSRGRLIYKGYAAEAYCANIDYIPIGAYWWNGNDDLSFYVSSAYDDKYIYFTVFVNDDSVTKPYNKIENGEAIEVYLDVNSFLFSESSNFEKNRFVSIKDDKISFNKDTTSFYKFNIYLGDFISKDPIITLEGNRENLLNAEQKQSIANLNVVADLTEKGYYAMFRIPFSLLGKNLEIKDDIIEIGCTISVTDIDNEFRPENKTVLQTSLFNEGNHSTYGSLLFIPDGKWYGLVNNVYKEKIIQTLEEFGF